MRMSRSPALAEVAGCAAADSSVTVEWRDERPGLVGDEGVKATADERRLAVNNFPNNILFQFVFVD